MESPVDIVLDLGCKTHEGVDSVSALIDRYHPSLLLGFDPLVVTAAFERDGTAVVLLPWAAWTDTGKVSFQEDALSSAIDGDGDLEVACFDLSYLLSAFGSTRKLVVKMDVEGAEYSLTRKLVEDGSDAFISLLLIEWHTGLAAHGFDETRPELRCPTEPWWM